MASNATPAPKAAPAPKQPPARPIKQDELAQVLTYRLECDALKRELKKAEEELLKAELLLMDRLEKHAPVQAGELSAAVDVKPGQVRPSWKEEYAKALGPAAIERVQQATPPGPEQKKLVITGQGRVQRSA